jgi:hypothetical protein
MNRMPNLKDHPLVIVGFFIVVILVTTAIVLNAMNRKAVDVKAVPPSATTSTNSTSDATTPPNADAPGEGERPMYTKAAALTLNWLAKPVARDYTKIFANIVVGGDYGNMTPEMNNATANPIPYYVQFGVYETGTVVGGELAGATSYTALYDADPSGVRARRFLISKDGKTMIVPLQAQPEELNGMTLEFETKYATLAPNLTIPALALPAKILTTMNSRSLMSDGFVNVLYQAAIGSYYTNRTGPSDVTTKEGVKLTAYSNTGCLFYRTPDGFEMRYSLTIPMRPLDGTESTTPQEVAIDWQDGVKPEQHYSPAAPGGCGYRDCADVSQLSDASLRGLQVAGTTAEGDNIFVPASLKTNADVKKVYENWMWYDANGKKPTLSWFLEQHPMPIFYWKDDLGRYIRYTFDGANGMAECGKPVIYLYPEKTETVSVRLPATVRVTKSIPTYERGWTVSAEPSGRLTAQDGATYGSLYWDGVGVNYATPKDGFMVKDGEVDAFFAATLPKYGFNATEADEFRAFWSPLFTGAAYYRISFLTDAWTKAAPLAVTPKPDTQIRVFMDWVKLGEAMPIAAPHITTPKRNGFTLVEWGGTLPN